MNKQAHFPFINEILPDPYWWTHVDWPHAFEEYKRRTQATAPSREPVTLVLIACSKSKLKDPAPAYQLYTGQLFKKATDWAQRRGLPWFVVSALYGLLKPDQTLSPYDFTIKDLQGETERTQWAHRVVACELTRHAPKGSHAFLIMPERYRRLLQGELLKHGITYENPLESMGIGRQMKWLIEN